MDIRKILLLVIIVMASCAPRKGIKKSHPSQLKGKIVVSTSIISVNWYKVEVYNTKTAMYEYYLLPTAYSYTAGDTIKWN